MTALEKIETYLAAEAALKEAKHAVFIELRDIAALYQTVVDPEDSDDIFPQFIRSLTIGTINGNADDRYVRVSGDFQQWREIRDVSIDLPYDFVAATPDERAATVAALAAQKAQEAADKQAEHEEACRAADLRTLERLKAKYEG